LEQMVSLRCKHCGAPLDKKDVESDSPYVTCPSCGTTQQRMDAEKYLNQMMGQIQSWISKSMPGGFSLAQSENVDSVARFNIFNNNIRPAIEAEFFEYKFATNALLSNALIVLPFTTEASIPITHDSNRAFEFNARAKSIEPLAVDGNSKEIVSSAEKISSAYAMLVNNTKLMCEDNPGRYILMGNNFEEARDSFSKIKGYELVSERFGALSSVCKGCDTLLNGNAMQSISYFEKGSRDLENVMTKVQTDLNLGIMFQAVEQEKTQADILSEISGFILNGVAEDPLKVLDVLRRILAVPRPSGGNWGYLLNNKLRYSEILNNLSTILKAKNGGTLPIAPGSGRYLVPFWDVDLKYSFQTGALWKKKTVEVIEDLLIPADFVTDTECLSNPSSAVTDIFDLRPEKSILSGITGNEMSISGGQGITRISQFAENSVNGRKVIVPLSTKREAERIMTDYLKQRTNSDSQLKLSKPYVKGLIYIPCEVDSLLRVPADFGKLVPARVKRTNPADLIII
jgi:uncharacterized Zn finger protein (UPF0148 family)